MRWFGENENDQKKEEYHNIVCGVIECFRNNDVEGMKTFVDSEGSRCIPPSNLNHYFWWDDKELMATKPILKPKSHHKKIISSHVRKAVRFDKDYTPEDKKERVK